MTFLPWLNRKPNRFIPKPSYDPNVPALLDTIVLIDNSLSMKSTDYRPSRIGAAVHSVGSHIDERIKLNPLDRFAVVIFSQLAIELCGLLELSRYRKTIFQLLDSIRPQSSTAMGEGLAAAERIFIRNRLVRTESKHNIRLTKSTVSNRIQRILLLTDGDHNDGIAPLAIAERLKRSNVQIDCIGIGGKPTDVNENLLKKIASINPLTKKQHYRFIGDSEGLIEHFRQLATSITR